MKTLKIAALTALMTIADQACAMDTIRTAFNAAKKAIKVNPQPLAPKVAKPQPKPWPVRPKGTIAGC